MNNPQNNEHSPQKSLRLWPGVVLAILSLVLRFIVPVVWPEGLYFGLLGSLASALAIILWWLFFSRARWSERLGALALMIVALFVTFRFVHVSIAKGAMGMLFPILAIPVLSVALVVWAVVARRFSTKVRRVTMVVTILIACGFWTLLRTGGFTGDFDHDFAWRWSQTPEERLLAQTKDRPKAASAPTSAPKKQVQTQPSDEPLAPPAAAAPTETPSEQTRSQVAEEPAAIPAVKPAEMEAEWPGFRGPQRDSIIRGIRINTDWSASPPAELWRRPIGPGWSSFAVAGDRFYTQEQRGENEIVACYSLSTGDPIWMHSDPARFWESNAGAGPRATPTLSNGRIYSFGATGIVNALDAADGAVVWTRNAATDTGAKLPGWGFASSPLVVDNFVIIAASGNLVAYDIATGNPRWFGPEGGTDYSSPHQVTIGGVSQILLMCRPGAISVAPSNGTLLWKYSLPAGTRIVQPAAIADGDVLISEGDNRGMRRIAVANGVGGWTARERWTSIGLKPYFNDFVVQDGYAFGFDGSFLSCVDLKDGSRKWKGGRYGHGQLILLADQKLLLVLSEKGEVALVSATAEAFKELAKFPALKGKTWNHPVLAGDVLLVRNGQEVAAFRLSLASE